MRSYDELLNQPNTGSDVEQLILLIKELIAHEEALETAKEKLILRCEDFSTQTAIQLFEPPEDQKVYLNLYNLKAAFFNVGMRIDNQAGSLVLKRYDSNFDGELTFSDV